MAAELGGEETLRGLLGWDGLLFSLVSALSAKVGVGLPRVMSGEVVSQRFIRISVVHSHTDHLQVDDGPGKS